MTGWGASRQPRQSASRGRPAGEFARIFDRYSYRSSGLSGGVLPSLLSGFL
jgi:hypothetical protein